jgi:hypothetical protein
MIRVGWRDLIFAVLWIVALAVPIRAMFNFITGSDQIGIIVVLTALAVLPGMVFTAWYVGRRRGP